MSFFHWARYWANGKPFSPRYGEEAPTLTEIDEDNEMFAEITGHEDEKLFRDDDPIYVRASNGDPTAFYDLNINWPGRIYYEPKLRSQIARHTHISMYSADSEAAYESKQWLKKALAIYRPNGGRHNHLPPHEHLIEFMLFNCYEDIVAIKHVHLLLAKGNNNHTPKKTEQILRANYEDLSSVPEDVFLKIFPPDDQEEDPTSPIKLACHYIGAIRGGRSADNIYELCRSKDKETFSSRVKHIDFAGKWIGEQIVSQLADDEI